MFNKTVINATANQKISLNSSASSFCKVSFTSGTLSANGYISTNGAEQSSALSFIGDKTFSVLTSTTNTGEIYTIDLSGYDYVSFGTNCTVFLYTEAR